MRLWGSCWDQAQAPPFPTSRVLPRRFRAVELRERAVRLVFEQRGQHESEWAAIQSIAEKFDEDRSRVRKDNAPENMAMLRHTALNLLKADTSTKVGIKTRRKMAGWSNDYLAHLLGITGTWRKKL